MIARILAVLAALVLPLAAAAQDRAGGTPAEVEVRRTILALYDGKDEPVRQFVGIHQMAQMPLNHLGLRVIMHDIRQGLPDLSKMPDVRGVLTWFQNDNMAIPGAYLKWAHGVIDSGRRYVIIDDFGFGHDDAGVQTPEAKVNRFLARLGLRREHVKAKIDYTAKVAHKVARMVEFERPLTGVLPAFDRLILTDPRNLSFLTVRHGDDAGTESQLVVAGPNGGYVAAGYVVWTEHRTRRSWRQWRINPFAFFRAAFGTDDLPKADTTTLSGRRLFYSHIDGDGWGSVTDVLAHRAERLISAEVIYRRVLKAYPDLPVSVGPIAADLDPAWYGKEAARKAARRIFALPNVEGASHTYSHPFDWEFFAEGDSRKERPFLPEYPARPGDLRGNPTWFPGIRPLGRDWSVKTRTGADGKSIYGRPRAYAVKLFDMRREIMGSVEYINTFMPAGKKVEVLLWSGNTVPSAKAIAMSREAGVRNLNGGDPRFDAEYGSYAWISPVGRRVGTQWQVYTSASNETRYTFDWTRRFYGFKALAQTLRRTETPYRIKPVNIYYHMYSGEKEAALNALIENIEYVQTLDITPVTASRFAAIGDGFSSARFVALGPSKWRVENRDGLQTIRFDNATFRAVDFTNSTGVIGQRHFQGSLYVALDPAVREPVIALRDIADASIEPAQSVSYLVEARWQFRKLQRTGAGFLVEAQGFGAGGMVWQVSAPGTYTIEAVSPDGVAERLTAIAGADGTLRFTVKTPAHRWLKLRVTRKTS